MSLVEELPAFDVVRVRADNPGPLTLSGTNTWVLGREPAVVVDPGPDDPAHLDAVARVVAGRGGAAGIALTHGHADHAAGADALRERLDGVPVAAARHAADVALADGDEFAGLEVVAVPGHAPDHLAFVHGRVCCTGDAVLGEGSVFVSPGRGSLSGYLAALRRLRGLDLELLCPGHGPPIEDPAGKLDEYVAHRLDREGRLLEALERGLREPGELLDAAWADVPAVLRPAAAITLAAHLDKLEEEGRLPAGVVRPS